MAEKGKDKKEEETLKHEKPPPFWWGCFVAIFDYKTGDSLRFSTNICPPSGVRAIYIYIYIEAVKLYLFFWGPKWGIQWVGCNKFYVEKFMCVFCPLFWAGAGRPGRHFRDSISGPKRHAQGGRPIPKPPPTNC